VANRTRTSKEKVDTVIYLFNLEYFLLLKPRNILDLRCLSQCLSHIFAMNGGYSVYCPSIFSATRAVLKIGE